MSISVHRAIELPSPQVLRVWLTYRRSAAGAPATTVMLARAFLGERWSAGQRFGLALALAAGVCISLG